MPTGVGPIIGAQGLCQSTTDTEREGTRERERTTTPPVLFLPPIGPPLKDDSQHRGRIQVQGPDMHPELSWPWARSAPLTAREGLNGLYLLEWSLTKRQREIRDQAFRKAADYIRIRGCQRQGGCGPVSRTFRNKNQPLNGKARVDIEILTGVAFV